MTPFEIGILLHYHVCCDDHPVVRRNPPVWASTRAAFRDAGLIRAAVDDEQKYGASWAMTERGHAYCDALTRVPLPESHWVVKWPAEDLR